MTGDVAIGLIVWAGLTIGVTLISFWWGRYAQRHLSQSEIRALARMCSQYDGLLTDAEQEIARLKNNPKPGTLNGKTLQQMIDDMVAQAVKDKGLAKAQAIVDALPPEHRDLVWRNGMARNSEARQ